MHLNVATNGTAHIRGEREKKKEIDFSLPTILLIKPTTSILFSTIFNVWGKIVYHISVKFPETKVCGKI